MADTYLLIVVVAADRSNKKVISQNCAPFPDSISEIDNTQVNNAKNLDVVMSMYNLIEHSDSYSKISGSLWQYCRDQPVDNIFDSKSFKLKSRLVILILNLEILLKYLSNFWRTLDY